MEVVPEKEFLGKLTLLVNSWAGEIGPLQAAVVIATGNSSRSKRCRKWGHCYTVAAVSGQQQHPSPKGLYFPP